MKKILIATLSALLLFSLAACSVSPASQEGSQQTAPSQGASSDGMQIPPDGAAAQSIQLLGKIKSLLGNEISLDLAKLSNGEAPESGEGNEAAISNPAQSVTVTDKATENASGGSAASGGGGESDIFYYSVDADGTVEVGGREDMPKLELEYTGGTKDLTIPAGLKIFDLLGQEVKMADLKEGNVLMVNVREDGSLEAITVME